MMYCPAEKLFFAADQVLNRISPNIGVPAVDPEDDVLGQYLDRYTALLAAYPRMFWCYRDTNCPFMACNGALANSGSITRTAAR